MPCGFEVQIRPRRQACPSEAGSVHNDSQSDDLPRWIDVLVRGQTSSWTRTPGSDEVETSSRNTLSHTSKVIVELLGASSLAYTSATARSTVFEAKTRSTRLPVHLTCPLTSLASKLCQVCEKNSSPGS